MDKNELINDFKWCLDILRAKGITGEKALKNMTYLLILKLIEPHLGNTIDIDNYEYDFDYIEDELVESHKTTLLKIARFSNLCQVKEVNLMVNVKYLWKGILSKHPVTQHIFSKNRKFDIKDQKTFKLLIDKINSINLQNIEYDVLGNAYEEVIKDIMTGKVLGQFFTQPLVKKIMVKLINPQIFPDGTIETCCDPTMGTGGFLITYLQYILKQAKERNIEPNWNFIKSEGLYGKELDEDTYRLSVSNMLISSGHIFENLDLGDSIREPITRKFDNILANPPFGIKTLNYNDFNYPLKQQYIPLKSNNAISLFLQAIIYMLKINGKCAIVLPTGQELYSQTKQFIELRRFLMKICDLQKIIILPAGIFTYTSIQTCILYFVKKIDSSAITDTHYTSIIKFYNYDSNTDTKNLLVKASIDEIIKKSYTLNHNEYIKKNEDMPKEGIVIKSLLEICSITKKTISRLASYGKDQGNYPFFTSSFTTKYTDEADYNQESIIIGTGGNANVKYATKFSCSNDNIIIKINDDYLTKYVYYYLLYNIDKLQNAFKGTTIKHLNQTELNNISIHLPKKEEQKYIVGYLDHLNRDNDINYKKIAELNISNYYYLNNLIRYENCNKNYLGELCKIIKHPIKRLASYGKISGEFPFYTSSQTCSKYCDIDDYNKESIIIGTGGKANVKYATNFSCSNDNFVIQENKSVSMKYIYYYLLLNISILQEGFIGMGLQHISKTYVKQIQIPVPSMLIQKEIIDYCENNEKLIIQYEKQIEANNIAASNFIK